MNVQLSNMIGGRRAPRRALFILLFALILLLGGCGSEPAAPPAAPTAASPAAPSTADAAGVTAETGGMTLPSTAAGADVPVSKPPAEPPAAPTATAAPALVVGAVVTTTAVAALYAEPDPAALRFAEYAAGSRLTVIEPDGDHAAYPVEVEGRRWYRVRAEDGLVGWIMEP